MLDMTKTKTNEVRIRAANAADDIPTLKAAVRALGRQQDTAMTTGDWLRELSRGHLRADVALDDKSEPVGVIITARASDPSSRAGVINLVAVYVAQSRRKSGIGSALLRYAVGQNNAVRALVPHSNTAAANLFRSAGFVASPDVLMVRSK